MRDLSGKFSWDASILYAPPTDTPDNVSVSQSPSPPAQCGSQTLSSSSPFGGSNGGLGLTGLQTNARDDPMTSSLLLTSPPRHTLRHRPPGVLPSFEDSADDLDNLDDVREIH